MKAALSPQLLAQPPDGVRGGRARPRFAREGKGFAGVFAGHTHFPLRSKSRSGPSVSLSPFTTDDGGEQHCFRGAAEDRSEESESFAAGERKIERRLSLMFPTRTRLWPIIFIIRIRHKWEFEGPSKAHRAPVQ
ncbi:hypothetical protein DFH06DRAFT_1146950 [Mycena polygramma]|nr:hypothetical protein DFH06DRAFT_1146950 [Mycena polygramma]